MDAIVVADSLDDLVSDWQDLRKKLGTNELKHSKKMDDLSQSAEEIRSSLQTSVNQVAAFRKSYPAARYSDFGEAYHYLNRLLVDAKPITGEIKDEINRQQEELNLKVSRAALEESRSAIASESLPSDDFTFLFAKLTIDFPQSPSSHSSSSQSTQPLLSSA
jgi:hypothetical protein